MYPSKNTRQQDLFLLAKGAYHIPLDKMVEAVRHIVGWSAAITPEHVRYKDAASVLLSEFVEGNVVLLNTRQFSQFLLEIGPDPHISCLGGNYNQDVGYYAALIESLMSKIRLTTVLKNDVWQMPFPRTEVDATMQEKLNLHLRMIPEIQAVAADRR